MNNEWLKERREKLGLSQDEIANRLKAGGLNVTRANVSHWENGRHNPPLNNAQARQAIATALDWTIPELLGSAGVITDQETLANSELAHQAAIIVDRLSATGQKLALDQLRDLEKRLPKNFGENRQYEGSLDDLLQLDMFKAIIKLKAQWNITGEEVAERMAKLAQIWPEVWDAESQQEL